MEGNIDTLRKNQDAIKKEKGYWVGMVMGRCPLLYFGYSILKIHLLSSFLIFSLL